MISESLTGEAGQYREVVNATDDDTALTRVALVRSCGRSAGRRARLQVRTLDHMRNDGSHEVLIVNVTPLDPDDEIAQARWQRRLRDVANAAAAPGVERP